MTKRRYIAELLTVTLSESKLSYDQRSVGQPLLVSGTNLGTITRFVLLSVAGMLMCLAGFVILWSECRRTQNHILLSEI
jgi:hypothetical protein